MILFEYTRRTSISPHSLSNVSPFIWSWHNPWIGIVDWMLGVFNVDYEIDTTRRMMFTNARIGLLTLSTVYSYDDMTQTPNSFWWDSPNQTAYFNLTLHPHSYSTMDLSALYGATYGKPTVQRGILYPNTLLSKPSVERQVEPVVYTKMATATLDIEMVNDEMWLLDGNNKPYKAWRFDDTKDLNGQTTFLKFLPDGKDYDDAITLHKGVIRNIEKGLTQVRLTCDDIRSMRDSEWPTHTFEKLGNTDVEEATLTKVVPDGFGKIENMDMVCINRSEVVYEKDDDGAFILPADQLVSWDMSTWERSSVDTVTRVESDKIGGFASYRVAKSASSYSACLKGPFTANSTTHKVSGYIRCDVANTPAGQTIVAVKKGDGAYVGEIWLYLSTQTFSVGGGAYNVRVKYNVAEDGKVTAYFSYEVHGLTAGGDYRIFLYPDYTGQDKSAVVCSAFRVSQPTYPTFRVARLFSGDDVQVFYEEDDELIELQNIVGIDKANGTVRIHDVDAHSDGIITNGLRTLYCTATLRPQSNPFDIIVELHSTVDDIPYISSFYDMARCDEEKKKLRPVALYKNSSSKLTQIIEELQAGSTVGFHYDDVDRIYITCDDPNRTPKRKIHKEYVVNKADIVLKSDLTLYADEVTVNWGQDQRAQDPMKYDNTDYKEDVLLTYNYANPLTYESLLITEEDARDKTIVLLEDLSVVRDRTDVQVHGLELLYDLDLYDIINVELERPLNGWMRAQIIGLEIDTDFELVTLSLRQRDYSEAFADISGSYGEVMVLGEGEEVIGQDEEVIGGME